MIWDRYLKQYSFPLWKHGGDSLDMEEMCTYFENNYLNIFYYYVISFTIYW